jgi:GNAT superfamily N-acetyltransferase
VKRLAKRLLPAFTNPDQYFVKAVLVSTGEVIGIAGWTGPRNKGIQNVFTRGAIDYYGWKETMGWTDDEIDEMFEHVSPTGWNEQLDNMDRIRAEVMGEEPHWYLAPLLTWPKYQGRGVGKKLLNWAIKQADATEPVTPMYLESAATARAVYMHCGFVPQGEVNMVRRGPAVVKGLEAEDETEKTGIVPEEKLEGVGFEVVEKEIEADTLVRASDVGA